MDQVLQQKKGLVKGVFNKVFKKYDSELVEINPLFITTDNTIIAGDGKLMIDDNSMARSRICVTCISTLGLKRNPKNAQRPSSIQPIITAPSSDASPIMSETPLKKRY